MCKRAITLAIAGPGRWTYIFGDLDAARDTAAMAEGIALYAGTPDGIVPWRQRPDVMKRNTVARIPRFSLFPVSEATP